jgi:hypothetical protein
MAAHPISWIKTNEKKPEQRIYSIFIETNSFLSLTRLHVSPRFCISTIQYVACRDQYI